MEGQREVIEPISLARYPREAYKALKTAPGRQKERGKEPEAREERSRLEECCGCGSGRSSTVPAEKVGAEPAQTGKPAAKEPAKAQEAEPAGESTTTEAGEPAKKPVKHQEAEPAAELTRTQAGEPAAEPTYLKVLRAGRVAAFLAQQNCPPHCNHYKTPAAAGQSTLTRF
ncbi:uncharacterized protein LOC112550803 [Alligator sinensis]|uniref:Uncharacterized protein LOC112550803 n=1 Tax=Alligator sinensis TaxID=38654 RepID=A0A3Q0GV13_ALLSI|nr:uncharacterized protein LOC112550803 [Alligator sinensis]